MDFRSSKGFTLLEMLVVLIIISVLLSLVTPAFFHVYEGIKISAEEQKLLDLIENVKMKAFLRKVSYTIIFQDKTLRLKDEQTELTFDFIRFPPCSLVFNRKGFSNKTTLNYLVMGENKILDVWP